MLEEFCIVCNDKSHFMTEVYNTKNINDYILNRINHLEFNRDFILNQNEDEIYSKIKFEHKIPHFMCGMCHKVNTQELISVEDELKHNFILSLRAIDSINDKDLKLNTIYDISRILQGDYPIMCFELKKYYNMY